MNAVFPLTIAYDFKRKQVGCAILQALCGGTIDSFNLEFFNNWLIAPTPDLKLYTIKTEEELQLAIKLTNSIHIK